MFSNKPRIITIGAGVSGLVMTKLLSSSLQCTLLESRNRIGGRTCTDSTWGIPIDMGAFVIHGIDGNPIMELVKKFQMPSQPVDPFAYYLIDQQNQKKMPSEVKENEERIIRQCELASTYVTSAKTDSSLEAAASQFNIGNLAVPLDYYHWRQKIMANYFGLETRFLSARFYNQEEVYPGGNNIMTSGYGPLVNQLKQGLNILLEKKVKTIDYSNSVIKVITTDEKVYETDIVVLTVPLGVLQKESITFIPELPQKKKEAIKNMTMGVLNKIILQFDECFWPTDSVRISSLKDNLTIPIFVNYMSYINAPVLVGLIGGNAAIDLEKFSDDEIVAMARKDLALIFNKEIPNPKRFLITRWANDIHSCGSYSCLKTDIPASHYDAMAETINDRIYFAGEATAKNFPGTVHGAYTSGVRVANAIAEKFHLSISLKDLYSGNDAKEEHAEMDQFASQHAFSPKKMAL